MGKTSKPISILCIGVEETPELKALEEQGHTVDYSKNDDFIYGLKYDVIIGPKCWRYFPDVSGKWLPLLLKEARAAQPPRVKKVKEKKK